MNSVNLVGNITRDLELKDTNGKGKCSFNLAVRGYKDHTDFIQCTIWDNDKFKGASNLVKYCSKGSKIAVEGRINTYNYDDKEGNKKYVTEVLCSSIEYLNTKKEESQEQTRSVNVNTGGQQVKDDENSDLPF